MQRWLSAFCAGVIILHCTTVLLPWWTFILASAAIFIGSPARYVMAMQCLLLGGFYANQVALAHQSNIIPPAYEGHWLDLEGQVCSVIVQRSRHNQFDFCTSEIRKSATESLSGPRKLRLSAPSHLSIAAGSGVIQLHAKLKRPYGSVNPVGGTYEQYLFSRRISGTGWVKQVGLPILAQSATSRSLVSYGLELRQALLARFSVITRDLEHAGILRALVMGDRSQMPLTQQRIMSETGSLHLMAISGLHVGMILLALWRFLPKTGPGVAMLALAGLMYVMLVGLPASAIRAWIMCCVLLCMRTGLVRRNWSKALVVAATVMLLIDPLSPMSMGFCLSFLTVAYLIFMAQSGWLDGRLGLRALLRVQLGFVFFLLPVNALYGLPHNLISIPANLVAIPWVSWLILPGGLLASMVATIDAEFSSWLFTLIDGCLAFLLNYLDALRALPGSMNLDDSSLRLLAFVVLLVVVIGLGRPLPISCLFLVCLAVSAWSGSAAQANKDRVVVLDVGQGLSVLVQHRQRQWVYDLGAAYERGSAAERALIPLKRAYFHSKPVDGLVISHGDNDHAGDLHYALGQLAPVERWSGEVERLGVQGFEPCRMGMQWHDHDLKVDVLYPDQDISQESANNRSCVLMLELKGKRFLFMGDLEGQAEKRFVALYGHSLKADVLIAGHHGSRNATSMALLKAVRPEIVVFSAGYRNRFGHPHGSTLERVKRFNARAYSTSESGALVFDLRDESMQISEMRARRRAFWMSE